MVRPLFSPPYVVNFELYFYSDSPIKNGQCETSNDTKPGFSHTSSAVPIPSTNKRIKNPAVRIRLSFASAQERSSQNTGI